MANLRKSASLIIASALESKSNKFDYKIMLLKRPKQMKAFPGFYVFPGGGYDQLVDQSQQWLKVLLSEQQIASFKSNPNLINDCFSGLIRKNSLSKLINDESPNKHLNVLPLEISFRLCAIRETFEETGLLLATHKKSDLALNKAQALTSYYSENSERINRWHEMIKKDSSKFVEMFLDLNLVPDIYGLHEWSNWITPSMEKFRFTTIFFTAFLTSQPSEKVLKRTSSEIESLEVNV